MNTKIQLARRSIYGTERWYVIDPVQRKALTALTGRQTINVDDGWVGGSAGGNDLAALTALGFTVELTDLHAPTDNRRPLIG